MLKNVDGVVYEDGKKLVKGKNGVFRRIEHDGCVKEDDVPASPESLFAKLGRAACPKIEGWEPPPEKKPE